MFWEAVRELTTAQAAVLLVCLGLAFLFECINGFHDTANAVATVIYTRSLRPTVAVVWSGLCNMAGILLGGVGVAFGIVHLLPAEMLANINTGGGLAMVLALLVAAILWNFATWYVGLPSSSSHTLIGAILGAAMANSVVTGRSAVEGVNLAKLGQIGLALLISPVVGFLLSALLLWLAKRFARSGVLDRAPGASDRPPWWVRGTLIGTCTGVSLAHGSNDGQKGMGIIMLVLIGLLPSHYALNMEKKDQCVAVRRATDRLETFVASEVAREELVAREPRGWMSVAVRDPSDVTWVSSIKRLVRSISNQLRGHLSFDELSASTRWELRQRLVSLDRGLKDMEKSAKKHWSKDRLSTLKALRKDVRESVEYVPFWVILMVALSLGLGTMVGWRRIVVTVGEKIGKSHLTYGQGAAAELVAMSTIGIADISGLPVSTTHVLSSGVAGTMWASRTGINGRTVRSIALAWLLTLPASMFLAALLLLIFRQILY